LALDLMDVPEAFSVEAPEADKEKTFLDFIN
jgi:hypothetical protein